MEDKLITEKEAIDIIRNMVCVYELYEGHAKQMHEIAKKIFPKNVYNHDAIVE